MTKARDLADLISAGNPLADGSIAASEVTGLNTVATSGAYTDLSGTPTLGTAAALDVGSGANNIVQLDGSGDLPAVSGANLTGLSSAGNLFSALADGTVTDGDMLILRSDGDVAKVAVEVTNYAFNSSNTAVNANNTAATSIERWKIATDKSDKSKFVIIGKRDNGSGFARAGSVSNGVVTFGNSTTFTNDFFEGDVCHIQGNYWAIAFRSNNEYGKLINWETSGNSLGTTYTFTTNSTYRISCDSPKNGGTDDDQVIVVWMDNNAGNRGEALVAVHVGAGGFNNTGTQYVFSGDDINGQTDVFFDHVNGNSQGIVTYRSNTDNLNYVVPFKFYSNTLTFGSNVSVGINAKNAGLGLRNNAIAYNENQSGVFVVALQNNTGDTIDVVPFTFTEGGANALPSNITKGTAFTGPAAGGETSCDVFLSSNSSNIGGIIFYNNTDNKVQVTDFTLSSNVATEGTTTDIATGGNDNDVWKSVAAEDTGNNFEFYGLYTTDGADPYVESFNLSRTVSATSLSLSPFVGVAQNSATTGQTVSVMTKGGIDDAQTGLTAGTTYYIQDNGSLGTSAGSVSKVAGTALSSTTLLIGD